MPQSDFLVIGSGVAGLLAAIKLSRSGTVNVVTKKSPGESNTNYAQGGIAAALDPSDSADLHIRDTLAAGSGLCHEDVVGFVVRNAGARIEELIDLGVGFTDEEAGDGRRLALGREGGHSAKRIVHAMDYTGREIEQALLARARASDRITFFENHIGIDLILESKRRGHAARPDRCWGAYAMDAGARAIEPFTARATVLATGGAGRIHPHGAPGSRDCVHPAPQTGLEHVRVLLRR